MNYLIPIVGLLCIINRASTQTCSIFNNIDFYGNDLFSVPIITSSLDDCCQICSIIDECRGWTYLPHSRACWLKKIIGEIRNPSSVYLFSGIVQNSNPTYSSTSSFTFVPITTRPSSTYSSTSGFTPVPITTPPSPTYSSTSSFTSVPITTPGYITTPSISFTVDSTTTPVKDSSLDGLDECNIQFNKAALEAHNFYRALHHVPPLTLDSQVIGIATAYAERLGNDIKQLVHSGIPGYGENLAAMFFSSSTDCAAFGKKFVKMWYDEISDYEYNKPGFSSGNVLFLQILIF